MVGIYKITNLINNKVYIGQSVYIEQRWRQHRYAANSGNDHYLYRAIRKYGIKNFSFTVIEQCAQDLLNEREQYWIKQYKSNDSNYGYNLTAGGQSLARTCYKLTLEQVKEIHKKLLTMTQQDIAKEYNVDQSVISRINTGDAYLIEGIEYPIKTYDQSIQHLCIDCGALISKGATRCINCSSKLRQKGTITREELKELIRTTPFVKIGEIYGVSDNAIRKWCQKYNLPSKKKDIKSYSDSEWEEL